MSLRVACCILMFFLGKNQYMAEEVFRGEYLPYLEDDMQLFVQGELDRKQFRNNQYIYELKSCVIGLHQNETSKKIPVPCNRILIYSDSDEVSIGEILVLNGTVELWESAANEGNFDAKSFYEAKKTDFKLKDIQILAVYGKKSWWREGLFELRLRLKEVYQSVMESQECGVMTTMVLGDKDLLEAEIKRLYQAAGLSHIMAISGLHISVIGMTLYRFLRKRGLGFWGAGILAGGMMYAYGTMVGMGTSVQRSIVMFSLMLTAQAVGRSYDTLNALGMAALLLLWQNPYLLWDAGFQFSFAAIIGVVWVGKCVCFDATRVGRCCEKIFASVAIQLTTLPLAAWYYYEIPLYAVLMNLFLLPMMRILLSVGIAGGFAGLISLKAAKVILFPCEKLLSWSCFLCGVCSKLPGAMWIVGRPGLGRVTACYGLLVLFTMYAYRKKQSAAEQKEDAAGLRSAPWSGLRSGKGRAVAAGMLLLAVLCFPMKGGFELDILDVGQGDGSFLRTEQGYTIFVDGGSSDVGKVGEYRILPFLKYKGVRGIDYWIVSHTDEDHISGLLEILESGYDIRHLVFAEGIVRDETLQELSALAEREGTEVLYLKAGDILHLGTAEIRAVFPAAAEAAGEDKNASSLVIRYEEGGFSGLFTGDIGTAQEKQLLESGELSQITFYKAAHHGSNYSNSAEFLEALRPLVSTVSCGAGNRYGHPGEEAVKHMEEGGSAVFYTMEAGQIKLTQKKGKLLVQKYLEPHVVFCFPPDGGK